MVVVEVAAIVDVADLEAEVVEVALVEAVAVVAIEDAEEVAEEEGAVEDLEQK